MAKQIGKGGSSAEKRRLEEAARQKRLQQNKGVKAGTIRPSAKGGGVRSYNAKTGRWDLLKGLPKAMAAAPAKKKAAGTSGTVSSAVSAGKRSATSGTVSSALSKSKSTTASGAPKSPAMRIREGIINFKFGGTSSDSAAQKAAARKSAAYMSGKPVAQPKPKTAAQKAAEERADKARREKEKAAARAQAKKMSGK